MVAAAAILDEDRRAELKRIVKGADAILFSESIEAEGAHVVAKAREMGLGGIISKRVGQHLLERAVPELDEGEEPRFQKGMMVMRASVARWHRRIVARYIARFSWMMSF